MKKTTPILIVVLFSLISCNNHYNKIEITFLRLDKKDSLPIEFNILKLSRKDSVIFNKNLIDRIDVGKKFIFDSLPDGKYMLEYTDLVQTKFTKSIELKENTIYKTKIIFDSLSLNKYSKIIPINNIKNGESYKLINWGGCVRMESYYQILRINNQFFLNSYVDNMRKLKDDEIIAIKKFETELYAIRHKGGCDSTGPTRYCIIQNNIKDTIIDHTCNWGGYRLLVNKLYN